MISDFTKKQMRSCHHVEYAVALGALLAALDKGDLGAARALGDELLAEIDEVHAERLVAADSSLAVRL